MKKQRITFTLSADVIEALRRLRRERGIAAAYVVETQARQYLEQQGFLKSRKAKA